jgi:hypothetical protein
MSQPAVRKNPAARRPLLVRAPRAVAPPVDLDRETPHTLIAIECPLPSYAGLVVNFDVSASSVDVAARERALIEQARQLSLDTVLADRRSDLAWGGATEDEMRALLPPDLTDEEVEDELSRMRAEGLTSDEIEALLAREMGALRRKAQAVALTDFELHVGAARTVHSWQVWPFKTPPPDPSNLASFCGQGLDLLAWLKVRVPSEAYAQAIPKASKKR